MSERKKPARWRKQPNETGLRSVGQGPRGYELRRDGETLIYVSADGGGWRRPLRGWYWNGLGVCGLESGLFKTAEEARDDADAFYKSKVKELK